MFIWQNCLPFKLTNFVSSKDNYDELTKNNLKFKDVYSIVQQYMSSSGDNYVETKNMLKSNFDEIRYVFSTLFPKIFSRTNESGRQLKSKFDYSFSLWYNSNYYNNSKQHEQEQQLTTTTTKTNQRGGKNMIDYKNRVFINEFEQKPVKNELRDVIEVLEQHEKTPEKDNQKNNNLIEVKNEEEINSFVKIKPMNEVKKNFVNEREQRKHAKLMKKEET